MSAASYARRYCEMDLALTWSPPGQKGPRHKGWNRTENAITDPGAAFDFWTKHPKYGVGTLLGTSKASLDVDNVPYARVILAAHNIDMDAIEAPRIVGNPSKFRLMFEAPPGIELRHRTASWPQKDNPRKSFAVFELRAGPVSDALPPTIHAVTGKPYFWAVPPTNGFPCLPDSILNIWTAWPQTEKRVRALCPWAPPEPERPTPRSNPRRQDGPSVIAEFNARHEVAGILEAHGYVRRGKRFSSPDTSHSAGVVVLNSGRCFCHHAGDPLGGGKALDAFDVFVRLDHGGNFSAAVRAAANSLGMRGVRA